MQVAHHGTWSRQLAFSEASGKPAQVSKSRGGGGGGCCWELWLVWQLTVRWQDTECCLEVVGRGHCYWGIWLPLSLGVTEATREDRRSRATFVRLVKMRCPSGEKRNYGGVCMSVRTCVSVSVGDVSCAR